MKTLLITHTDLDGVSPIILMNLTKEKFDYKTIEVCEVRETISLLLDNNFEGYDKLYITDLTIPEDIYESLIAKNIDVKVFDHHETHLYANKYPFVTVKITLDEHPTCATEIFYEYLKGIYPFLDTPIIKDYVKQVRELDTYTFTSEMPNSLDIIKKLLGKNDFVKSITRRLKKDKKALELTAFEKRYIKLKALENERYIIKRSLNMKTYMIQGYKCGIVFAESNKSALGNYLSLKYPNLDLIAIIDASSSVSYRTARDDVSVEVFATKFGGGGHQKASGSNISDAMREEIIKVIFGEINRLENENL